MSNLTRYDLEEIRGCGEYDHIMSEQTDGDYVKFDDIKELLNSSHNTASTPLKCVRCGVNRVSDFCVECVNKMLKESNAL